jgi:hypothetical protein
VTCDRCGLEHVASSGGRPCKGHIRYHLVDGERVAYPEGEQPPCKGTAMHGQDVCHAHGGTAPQNRAAAERRLALAAAERAMLTFGERVDVEDPGEEFFDLICWSAGHLRWLRERIQVLDEESLTWGISRNKTGGDDAGTTEEAGTNALLVLYERQFDRHAKLCAEAIKIGLKEREIRLAERYGDMMTTVFDGVLAELGFDPDDPAIAEIVERHWRQIEER